MAIREEYKSSFLSLLQNGIEEQQNSIKPTLKWLQDMFDLSYTFLHPYIRLEIDKSKNGYVHWKFIFSMPQFKNSLTKVGAELKEFDEPLAGALFHYFIKKYSKKLRSNPGGVRRIGSFDIGDIKYLLARNYPSFQQFKQLLSVQTSITTIQQDIYNKWAVISTIDPQLIVQKYDGYVWMRKQSKDCTEDESEDKILRVYSNSDYLRFQDHSKKHWNMNRFNSLYTVRKVIAYPCYKKYQKKRYEDEESSEDEEKEKKKSEQRLTDGMEEES